MWRLLRWMTGKRGDMVWNALVIVTVMIPLMGLTVDIPRYFILRTTLQNAADAAAEAAAQTLDAGAFINEGDVSLASYATDSATRVFYATAAPAADRGYAISLDGVSIDERADEVTVTASGRLRYLFGLTPEVTISVQAASRFRSLGF